MMLILTEGNTGINKGQVTISYLESRNHCIFFNSDLNNNPLVFRNVNVDNYDSILYKNEDVSKPTSFKG